MADVTRTEDQPHDRLTRISESMADTMDAHPETIEGDKAIIFLDDGERGGICIHGYDHDLDAMVDLFVHLKAVFEANGKTLMMAPIGAG